MGTGSTPPVAARTRSRSKAHQQPHPAALQPSQQLSAAPAAPPILHMVGCSTTLRQYYQLCCAWPQRPQLPKGHHPIITFIWMLRARMQASPRGKRSKVLSNHPLTDSSGDPASYAAPALQPTNLDEASREPQQRPPMSQASQLLTQVSEHQQPASCPNAPPAPSAKEIAAAAAARARLAGEVGTAYQFTRLDPGPDRIRCVHRRCRMLHNATQFDVTIYMQAQAKVISLCLGRLGQLGGWVVGPPATVVLPDAKVMS